MSSLDASSAPSSDGRTARRDRNRLAVLDALIELFAEDVEPSPEEVARRSGVSPRSVYRYFEDRQALMRAAMQRNRELVYPLFVIDGLGEGELTSRIEAFAHGRVRLYEHVANTSRAARHRAARDPLIAQQYELTSKGLREQVAQQFARELNASAPSERRSLLAAIDALSQLETLDYLGHTRGLSSSALIATLVESLHRLLEPRPTPTS